MPRACRVHDQGWRVAGRFRHSKACKRWDAQGKKDKAATVSRLFLSLGLQKATRGSTPGMPSNAWSALFVSRTCFSLSLSLFLSLSLSLSLSLCKRGENDAWSGGKETGEQAEASKRRRVSVGAVVARNRHQSSGCAPACGQGGRAGRMRSPAAASCPPRRHPAAGGMPCRGCSSWPSLAPLATLPSCSSDSVSLPLSPSLSLSLPSFCLSFVCLFSAVEHPSNEARAGARGESFRLCLDAR